MKPESLFQNRSEAGRRLAAQLKSYSNQADVIVLGLPRGGVPVAYRVADALNAPLDVYLVRKLGVPGHEEMAMGAIAADGVRYLNFDLINQLEISTQAIKRVVDAEQRELARREAAYRHGRPPLDLADRTVLIVDDGLATGATMTAAVQSVQRQSPKRVVVAVPVASPEICSQLAAEVSQVVCTETPQPFYAVGLWYEQFDQTTDEEVKELLYKARVKEQTLAP